MLMTTIPRRHIYEVLLELEDVILEMQALIFNNEHYDKFIELFNDEKIDSLKIRFYEIVATLPLFLENKKFEKREELETDISYYLKNKREALEIIKKNKNISKENTDLIFVINLTLEELKNIESYKQAKDIFSLFDDFDNMMPQILEIRRDYMV